MLYPPPPHPQTPPLEVAMAGINHHWQGKYPPPPHPTGILSAIAKTYPYIAGSASLAM
jgi:hypothetical protein